MRTNAFKAYRMIRFIQKSIYSYVLSTLMFEILRYNYNVFLNETINVLYIYACICKQKRYIKRNIKTYLIVYLR